MIFSCFTYKLKENVGGLLGGGGGGGGGGGVQRVCCPPPRLQIMGGRGLPPFPTPSSYAYEFETFTFSDKIWVAVHKSGRKQNTPFLSWFPVGELDINSSGAKMGLLPCTLYFYHLM